MLLFIAVPLAGVAWNSVHLTRTVYEQVDVETCSPGFPAPVCVIEAHFRPARDVDGNEIHHTQFVGLENYHAVLETEKLKTSLIAGDIRQALNIHFWRALRFTLMFTLVTLPFILVCGLLLALAVHGVVKRLRAPVIFISLLPLIITPIVGALSIRWLFVGDGVATVMLENWLQRDIAMFAQAWTIEALMYLYRIWHIVPFAFIVLFAGMQTMNREVLESALIDGASYMQRTWYLVIPHLKPLMLFVALIHLMDAYRVFDEIVGFSSQAHVISLQWLTYDYLTINDAGVRHINRASASAVLTMIGILLLLILPLRRVFIMRQH